MTPRRPVVLTRFFGARHGGATPLLDALAEFVRRPVRVRYAERNEDDWGRGELERIVTGEREVSLFLAGQDGTDVFCVPIDQSGMLRWTCPRRISLRVFLGRRRVLEVHDNRPIRILDDVERELGLSLTEADPVKRHMKLGALHLELSQLIEDRWDPDVRLRFRALMDFLEDYETS